jgi:hypothetical protein
MVERSDKAHRLAKGVQALLSEMGYAPLTEVKLRTGRRVDVMGVSDKGQIVVVEIKSGSADYRSDSKWQEYLDYCDAFYFAVAEDFPTDLLPEDQGLMITDEYQCEIIRPSGSFKLNSARRKNITLRFARQAANRLHQVDTKGDPKSRRGF